MKTLALILVLASPAMAQSYDWTLTNDPTFACPGCARVIGNGMFTASPNLFSNIQGSGYPILFLTGTLNGAPISLAPVPAQGLGNLFYKSYLPVSWFAPLYFSTASGTYVLTQSDITHPGTGQALTGPGVNSPVSFIVTPAPQFSSHPLLSSNSNAPVLFRKSTPARHSFQPVTIEISVPAAIALGVAIYEWHHHRTHRDAYPAGRF